MCTTYHAARNGEHKEYYIQIEERKKENRHIAQKFQSTLMSKCVCRYNGAENKKKTSTIANCFVCPSLSDRVKVFGQFLMANKTILFQSNKESTWMIKSFASHSLFNRVINKRRKTHEVEEEDENRKKEKRTRLLI